MLAKKHPFHLVPLSPLPILTSLSVFILAVGLVLLFHHYIIGNYLTIIGGLTLFVCLWKWWKTVIDEGKIENHHTGPVRVGLRIGMVLFIITEIMLFFSIFFSFFAAQYFPVGILDGIWVVEKGVWPPAGIETLDPWSIPFINTLILLLSGTTVTWAYYAVEEHDQKNSVKALGLSVLLGVIFIILQCYEYYHAKFKFSDGIYASNFYLATGFHGFHVFVGIIFLLVCFFRAKKGDFISGGYLGFEFASWYWHFVDVVWLFLFIFVYILGR